MSSEWQYKRIGFFHRLAIPHRIQRYLCQHCRVSFSRQTFSTTYYLKRPDLLSKIFMKAVGGMANRQIARDLGAGPATIDRQLSRLGRHCMLFHFQTMVGYVPKGDIVVDGFESFEYSQYFPIHHHLAVDAETSFFIYSTDSELRRKGRMRPEQKKRRAELEQRLGRPDPKAIEKDMTELLRVSLRGRREATVRSDDHPAYPRAIRRITDCEISRQVTKSTEHRTAGNPMFEVNLLDLLIRHSQANHRRETIAWSKRRQSSAERLAILQVWRNYVKKRWEKGARETPAMLVGLTREPLSPQDVLRERLFRTHVQLPPRWAEYYGRRVRTRALSVNRTHNLKRAW